eukprot:scaffold238754_cov19-Tisochrysis_lutea.AAC.2
MSHAWSMPRSRYINETGRLTAADPEAVQAFRPPEWPAAEALDSSSCEGAEKYRHEDGGQAHSCSTSSSVCSSICAPVSNRGA